MYVHKYFALDSDSDSTGLDQDKEASESSQQEQHGSNSVDQKTAVDIVCPMIHHGDPLTDRKSTFQAHAAEVHTTGEVSITILYELQKYYGACSYLSTYCRFRQFSRS